MTKWRSGNKKPDISRVIYVDEEIFNIIKGINIEYDSDGKYTPIYVSESFKEIIPLGTSLTSQIRIKLELYSKK